MKKILFLTMILFFTISLNAQEHNFKKACKKNSIEAFDEFIYAYPFSEFTEEAAFRRAGLFNTPKAFEEFLRKYPSGDFYRKADSTLCLMEFRKIKSTDDIGLLKDYFSEFPDCYIYNDEIKRKLVMLEYKKAEEKNTVKDYKSFINTYPSSEFDLQAKNNIQKLELDNIKQTNSIPAAHDYIVKYPDGFYLAEAKAYLEYLEFDLAVYLNSLDSLNLFLLKYPESKYVNDVNRKIEQIEFYNAKTINTIDEINKYLQKYPAGIYVAVAIKAIDQINFNNQAVVKNLYSKDPYVCTTAARELGEMMDPLAVEPLIDAFKENDHVSDAATDALVKINDTSAVLPLIEILEDQTLYYERTYAARALGELKDSRAVLPLIEALDEGSLNETVTEALVLINDTSAIMPLIALLNDGTYLNLSAAEILGKMGATQAIPALVKNLANWDAGEKIADALHSLGWAPTTLEESVHLWVANRNKELLISNWTDTKRVLLSDGISTDYQVSKNAVYAFIIIGKREIIPDLVEILNSYGNKTMAETYLNCGNKELRTAAVNWASDHGYSVNHYGGGSSPASWGGR